MPRFARHPLTQHIASDFFPRWRASRWRFQIGDPPGCPGGDGWCDKDGHTVWIASAVAEGDRDERDRTVIHEVCHAVTTIAHKKMFLGRLGRAAQRADEVGRLALAALLQLEVSLYEEEPDLRAADVYEMVRAAAVEVTDFDEALERIACQIGMTPANLRAKYTLLRRKWSEARSCYVLSTH